MFVADGGTFVTRIKNFGKISLSCAHAAGIVDILRTT